MSENRRRWFDNPFVIVALVVLGVFVLLSPFLAVKTYYVADRYINEPVVEIGNPTAYSREEVLEAVEVVKDAFYDDFPYSKLKKITYIDASSLKDSNQIEFKVEFDTSFFGFLEEPAAEGLPEGRVSLWYWGKKTEQGNWESTGFSSIG